MDNEKIESKVRDMLSEMTLNMDEYKLLDIDVWEEMDGYINFKHANGFNILVDFDLLGGEVQLTEVTLEY